MRILIIDQNRDFRRWLVHQVGAARPDAAVVDHDPSGREVMPPDFTPAGWDLIFCDGALLDTPSMGWISEAPEEGGCPGVVAITPPGDSSAALAAFEAGAADYLARERASHQHIRRIVREALRRGRRMPEAGRPGTGDPPPFELRGHRFVRTLSSTATASVYLMENESRGEPEVMKVFRRVPDVDDAVGPFERFLREYEVISGIRHPNVVRINDLGVADDLAYIAMEYFPGGHLGDLIAQGMPAAQAREVLDQMAAGLEAVHAVGVLHRDLKPGNVAVRHDGSIALIDFGLAKLQDETPELTVRGEIFGTPYYMSPEQGHGRAVDARSDLYSAGIVLHEMLTSRKPYVAASPMSVIWKHRHAPIPRLPAAVGQFQGILERLLAKLPEDRFASAAELRAALQDMAPPSAVAVTLDDTAGDLSSPA
ncbi:MAG: serine/threonine-protein kinase [Gammaproteobacteria bacterium]